MMEKATTYTYIDGHLQRLGDALLLHAHLFPRIAFAYTRAQKFSI